MKNDLNDMQTDKNNSSEKKVKSARLRRIKAGGYSAILCVIVAVVVGIFNMLVGQIPKTYIKIDLSAEQLATLSQQTMDIVKNVDQDIRIYFLTSTGNEDSRIQDLLERYCAMNPHITTEEIDAVTNPDFASKYTTRGLNTNSLIVVSDKRSTPLDFYDIYNYNVTDYETGEYTMSFNGESVLTGAIDYVTSNNLPVVYMLSGQGEQPISADIQDTVEQQSITLETLNLVSEGAVPDDAKALILMSPSTDISENDLQLIKAYLSGGGALMLVTDYSSTDKPNLAKLMSDYGVQLVQGVIVEGDASHTVKGSNQFLLPEYYTHEITEPLQDAKLQVMMPLSQGITKAGTVPETVAIAPLLKSTNKSYSKIAGDNITTLEKEDGDIDGPFDVGVAISDSQTDAKLVWYTTSLLFNETTNNLVAGANADLILNSLGWLCEREQTISIHAKDLQTSYMMIDKAQANTICVIVSIVIPVIVIAIGLVVWLRRRKL